MFVLGVGALYLCRCMCDMQACSLAQLTYDGQYKPYSILMSESQVLETCIFTIRGARIAAASIVNGESSGRLSCMKYLVVAQGRTAGSSRPIGAHHIKLS